MRWTNGSTRLVVGVAVAAILAACGGGDDTADADATESMAGDEMATDEMSEMEGMDEGDEHSSFAFGEAADAADADRTVTVEAQDALAYDPASVAVTVGETITFEVTNVGQAVHEFVIGDTAMQEEHEEEMAEMAGSGMQMQDEPNAIRLGPGETKSITWRFTEAGELQFACHQPGHYGGGMIGTFEVS